MGHQNILFLLLSLFLFSQNHLAWGWFFSSSSSSSSTETPTGGYPISGDVVAEFSMETLNNRKGVQLLDNAKKKMASSNTCWQDAYQNLFAGCSEILAGEEKRARLAWHLTDCFQKDSGRPGFPPCDSKSSMVKCRTKLDESALKIYLEFYLETNAICHQLQTDAFKRQTERLVNELKKSAEFAEDKLDNIEEKAEVLLQSSNHIHESLASIDTQTREVAKITKDVEDHVNTVLKHSEAVHEQSKEIASSQTEIQEGQEQMKHKLEESMAVLHESYDNVVHEISRLKSEAAEIERRIAEVGKAMDSKMSTLQSKADDIGSMAGASLDKQKKLLEGQSVALEGLQFLTQFQSQALQESKGTLQQLVDLREKEEEDRIQRQSQLQQAHDRLVENSKTILEAQESFGSKQASMFIALDKLFTLHNAMLLESRLIKAFIIYSVSIFVLHILTSTKETYAVRSRLYMGLCATFLIEFAILRYGTSNIEQQTWMISSIRSIFVLAASTQLLHAICTYRDIELINHHLLLKLADQNNGMRAKKEFAMDDADSDVDWSLWVDTDIQEDLDLLEDDPDYTLPEEVGENSIATPASSTRRYNFRSRSRRQL